jgi:hypothetical protein
MKTLTGTCNLCGRQNTSLIHDGRSFLICEDAKACMDRVKQAEQAEYDLLGREIETIQAKLNPMLVRRGQLEVSLGLYDAVVLAHRAEMARIEAEN